MPALYEAGRVYDEKLHDYVAAIKNYEMALKTGKNEERRTKAMSRLNVLKKQEIK